MRGSVVSAVLVAPILALSACSGGGDDPQPVASSSAPAQVEVPTDPADLPDDLEQAKQLQVALLAESQAEGAEQDGVVKAWMGYHQALLDSTADLELAPGLDDISAKEKDEVATTVDGLKAKKQRVVGWSRDTVLSVSIRDDSAGLHVCAENRTFAVDADDQPVADPVPLIDYIATFKRVGGDWQLDQVDSIDQQDTCIPD